jgi:hypothetical protein
MSAARRSKSGLRTARRGGSDLSHLALGLDANWLRTVSYGSEFPLDPAHRNAWSRNRRAHFVITAK